MAYTRNTWTDGEDTIVASKLNNMEAGIAANANAIDELNTNRVWASIKSSVTPDSSNGSYVRKYYAWTNGMLVYLFAQIQCLKGSYNYLTVDSSYRPFQTQTDISAFGFYNTHSTSADTGLVRCCAIDSNGVLSVWTSDAFSSYEVFCFIYPLGI